MTAVRGSESLDRTGRVAMMRGETGPHEDAHANAVSARAVGVDGRASGERGRDKHAGASVPRCPSR